MKSCSGAAPASRARPKPPTLVGKTSQHLRVSGRDACSPLLDTMMIDWFQRLVVVGLWGCGVVVGL